MCLTAKDIGLQEENINISKSQGKTTNYEKRDGVPQKERETGGQKERERRRGM